MTALRTCIRHSVCSVGRLQHIIRDTRCAGPIQLRTCSDMDCWLRPRERTAWSYVTVGSWHSEIWLMAADAPKCDYQLQKLRNVTTICRRPEMWLPAADAPKCDYRLQMLRNVTTACGCSEMWPPPADAGNPKCSRHSEISSGASPKPVHAGVQTFHIQKRSMETSHQ